MEDARPDGVSDYKIHDITAITGRFADSRRPAGTVLTVSKCLLVSNAKSEKKTVRKEKTCARSNYQFPNRIVFHLGDAAEEVFGGMQIDAVPLRVAAVMLITTEQARSIQTR